MGYDSVRYLGKEGFMALLDTPVCDFGWRAEDFCLVGVDDREWSLGDVRGARGTLIMFICNHCPYVRGIAGRLEEDMAVPARVQMWEWRRLCRTTPRSILRIVLRT